MGLINIYIYIYGEGKGVKMLGTCCIHDEKLWISIRTFRNYIFGVSNMYTTYISNYNHIIMVAF